MTMKMILTSELSRRATTDRAEQANAPFASVIAVSSMEGRSELLVTVEFSSAYGSEKKKFILPTEMMDSVRLSFKNLPYEINEETLDALSTADAVAHALYRAYGMISYGACSYKKLWRKLREKGVESEIADLTVDIVKGKGYIDEDYLARRSAELCLKKYWGRSRILRKLREDGYSEDSVEVALEYLDTVDFAEQCASFIEKKYVSIPTDRYEMQKMLAAIARYGYSGSEIREAVRIYNSRN